MVYIQFVPPSPRSNEPPTDLPKHRAQPIIDAGLAIEVNRHKDPAVVTWQVKHDVLTNRVELLATCSRACGKYAFRGDPSLLALDKYRLFYHGCCTEPVRAPEAIVDEYKLLREGLGSVRAEKSDMLSYEQAERLSDRAAKKLDGARLDAQIALEEKQRKALSRY